MTAWESDQLRAETWNKIIKAAGPLSKIPGVAYCKIIVHYGTGEPNPNRDFDPCVLTVGELGFGSPGGSLQEAMRM